jgi:hypothetical protein
VHILVYPMFLYKLYFMATPRHSKPLLLNKYIYIVVLAPDLQKVSVYSNIDFPYHGSTAKLLLLLILIKWPYPSFTASLQTLKSLQALWLLWHTD